MDERLMDQLRNLPDEELGRALADAAEPAFPRTPDVTFAVRTRLEREALAYPELAPAPAPAPERAVMLPPRRFAWPRVRRATALAILAIVLLAALAAAVILGVPGIRFTFVPALPSQTPAPASVPARPGATPAPSRASPAATPAATAAPSLTASPGPSTLGGGLFLGTPADLGNRTGRPPVPRSSCPGTRTWARRTWHTSSRRRSATPSRSCGARDPGCLRGTTGVAALLTEFEGAINPNQFQKLIGPGTTVTPVRIGGAPGYWLHGADHFFVSSTATSGNWDEQRVRLAGDTLLWNVGRRRPIAWRLPSRRTWPSGSESRWRPDRSGDRSRPIDPRPRPSWSRSSLPGARQPARFHCARRRILFPRSLADRIAHVTRSSRPRTSGRARPFNSDVDVQRRCAARDGDAFEPGRTSPPSTRPDPDRPPAVRPGAGRPGVRHRHRRMVRDACSRSSSRVASASSARTAA